MQPIPVSEVANTIIIVVLSLAVALGALSVVLAHRNDKRVANGLKSDMGNTMIAFMAFLLVVLVGGIVYIVVDSVALDRRTAQVQAQIEDSYGLELSTGEVGAIRYPEEAPEKDFKVYGSIDQQEQVSGAEFIERTVYLVWADGKLQLSKSEDGKSFIELDPAE